MRLPLWHLQIDFSVKDVVLVTLFPVMTKLHISSVMSPHVALEFSFGFACPFPFRAVRAAQLLWLPSFFHKHLNLVQRFFSDLIFAYFVRVHQAGLNFVHSSFQLLWGNSWVGDDGFKAVFGVYARSALGGLITKQLSQNPEVIQPDDMPKDVGSCHDSLSQAF